MAQRIANSIQIRRPTLISFPVRNKGRRTERKERSQGKKKKKKKKKKKMMNKTI